MIYAGIGSRETPHHICKDMFKRASLLAKAGWTLRSGHADGADKAFESGCDSEHGKKEIYIPWKGFNGSTSHLYHISDEALKMASSYHPNWSACSRGARLLHARNCYQILGYDLKTPCNGVFCWTRDGKPSGGTGQALRIALDYKIEIIYL